jgi:hyperosmotically inducible protein
MISSALVMAVGVLLGGNMAVLASETDERIEATFKSSFVFKTYLRDDSITLISKEGAVTLGGSVRNEAHKAMAGDVAETLPGVRSVDNRIEVRGAPPEKSDEWLGLNVKLALMYHRNVNARKTEVSVKNGVVTLKGEANSEAQKELTAEHARDVSGVKGVQNEMTVEQTSETPEQSIGDAIDDSSITAQIKSALLLHRSTGVLRTHVETNNGVVTLGGEARNAAEKDLVTHLVEDINGVKSVVNNMSIKFPAQE